jgi:hypothetical protein
MLLTKSQLLQERDHLQAVVAALKEPRGFYESLHAGIHAGKSASTFAAGTQFSCFASTNIRILTPEELLQRRGNSFYP